jgi:glycosyltransferase involved in cell wall biosynthesis
MKLPTLSIIIPNFNHGHCLPVAVNAIVKQSAQPFEIILIDDGSTDRSVEVIQELARQHPVIKFHRNEKNQGVCYTINRGIDLAQGEYLFFSAADDAILPGFLEKSLRVLGQHPQAGLNCTVGDWREEATGLHWHMGVGMAETPSYLSPQQLVDLERRGRLFIAGHTVIVRKAALLAAGGFQDTTKYAADWYTFNLIGFKYGICVVPEVLAVNRITPNTFYLRSRRDKQADLRVMEDILRLWGQEKWQDAIALMRSCGALYIWGYPMLKTLVRHGEYRHYLTLTFLRKNLWHITKRSLKRAGPAWLVNLYCKLIGYQAKPQPGG